MWICVSVCLQTSVNFTFETRLSQVKLSLKKFHLSAEHVRANQNTSAEQIMSGKIRTYQNLTISISIISISIMMILPMVQPPPPLCAQLEMFVCCVGTLTSQQLSSASNQQSLTKLEFKQ